MRIFVTGATGFIGRALIPRLQREGHSVVAWVRSEARARGLLGAAVEVSIQGKVPPMRRVSSRRFVWAAAPCGRRDGFRGFLPFQQRDVHPRQDVGPGSIFRRDNPSGLRQHLILATLRALLAKRPPQRLGFMFIHTGRELPHGKSSQLLVGVSAKLRRERVHQDVSPPIIRNHCGDRQSCDETTEHIERSCPLSNTLHRVGRQRIQQGHDGRLCNVHSIEPLNKRR